MKNRIKIYIFIIKYQNFIYIYLNYFSIMKNRIELFTMNILQIQILNIYHVLYFLLIIILNIINIQMKYYYYHNFNIYLFCII